MDNLFTAEGIQTVAAEALAHLQDALVLSNLCATDVGAEYNKKSNGYMVGDTIQFKIDPVYEAKEFIDVVEAQPIRSSNRSMTIEKHLDVTTQVSARDKALSFEGFSKEVIQPAAYALAEKVDQHIASKIKEGHGMYTSTDLFGGVSGSGGADLAQARKVAIMQQLGREKFCLLNPTLEATLLGQDWFTGAQNRGDDRILRSGELGTTMGFDFFSSVNFEDYSYSNSEGSATVEDQTAIDAANAVSITYNMVGTYKILCTAVALGITAGNRIAVEGCKRPMIVAEDAAISATEITVVDPITEIIQPGAGISVTGGVTAGDTVDISGAMFDSKSLAVAMPMLDTPETGLSFVVSNNGVSIRVVADYNSTTKVSQMSMDLLVGAFALDPRRITLLGTSTP